MKTLLSRKIFIVIFFVLAFPNRSLSATNTLDYSSKTPAFRPDVDWINTTTPLKIEDLVGKFVLVNFWTSTNMLSLGTVHDLKRLAGEFPDDLVVVGIHAGKFPMERETDNVRAAVARYGILYPVGNDAQHRIWRDYAVEAWPTTVLIDPQGVIIARHVGGHVYRVMKEQIQKFHKFYAQKIDPRQIVFPDAPKNEAGSALRFPTGILVDRPSNMMFIADSGNNRIIVSSLNGTVIDVIGQGTEGNKDGSFDVAQFRSPQGLAKHDNILYVADQGNNYIRKADLLKRQVETAVSADNQALFSFDSSSGMSRESVNAPWGLAVDKGRLYISMAGANQIDVFDMKQKKMSLLAGGGGSEEKDGPLLQSSFSQPSGLLLKGKTLYVTDSQSGAVRVIELGAKGDVKTLTGFGRFEFGDRDGVPAQALLQYPTGIDMLEESLIFCDTLNNKIKIFNPAGQQVETLAGHGGQGAEEGAFDKATFSLPTGIAVAEGQVFVADTNNHQIRVLDLEKKMVSTLSLVWPTQIRQKFLDAALARQNGDVFANRKIQKMIWPTTQANPIKRLNLNLQWPPGYSLAPDTVSHVRVFDAGKEIDKIYPLKFSYASLPVGRRISGDKLFAEFTLFYHDDSRPSVCFLRRLLLEIPVRLEKLGEDLPLEFSPLGAAVGKSPRQ